MTYDGHDDESTRTTRSGILDTVCGLHRGSRSRLLDGFVRKCVPYAKIYRRATGFFSSTAFSSAFEEFVAFFRRGGIMELVCSPLFCRADIQAFYTGLYDRRRWEAFALDEIVGKSSMHRHRDLLAWATANGQLETRIAAFKSKSDD